MEAFLAARVEVSAERGFPSQLAITPAQCCSIIRMFVPTSRPALGALQRIFGTVALTSRQWGICLLGPIALLLLLELGKLGDRRLSHDPGE